MQTHNPPQMPKLQSQSQRTGGIAVAPARTSQQSSKSFLSKILPTIVMFSAFGGLCTLGWYSYQEATVPKSTAEIPIIKADASPFKIKPADPGGMAIPNLDKEIFNAVAGREAETIKTVASSEEPLDRDSLRKIDDTSDIYAAAPSSGVSSGIELVQVVEDTQAIPANSVSDTDTPNNVPDEGATPSMSESEGIQETIEHPAKTRKTPLPVPDYYLREKSDLSEEGSTHSEVPTPVKRPEEKKLPDSMAEKPALTKPESMKPAPITGTKIQLGAFRTTAEAKQTWQKLKTSHASLLGKLNYEIEKADLGSKGIFYRLKAGPVSDKDAARSICKNLIAKKQGCFVVK